MIEDRRCLLLAAAALSVASPASDGLGVRLAAVALGWVLPPTADRSSRPPKLPAHKNRTDLSVTAWHIAVEWHDVTLSSHAAWQGKQKGSLVNEATTVAKAIAQYFMHLDSQQHTYHFRLVKTKLITSCIILHKSGKKSLILQQ
jgi:hypothetical protein